MKKVLSFVLVLAMILGSVSLAFAAEFTDTKGTSYDEAARLLSDLGVISGKTSTTFAPNDSITRAEYVAMVIRALGFGQQGSAVTVFTEDVPASYWASGYIKVANELGITFGKTATRFAPKDNITNDEMIAMLIRALGYKVQYLQGSFPSAQINQALQLDILENIPTGSTAAKRGDVAQLIYNALDAAVVSYDGNGNIIPGGTTLAIRCGALAYDPDGAGAAYDPGDPFVVLGTEDSEINLKPYVGAFVTAYAGKAGSASAGKIIAIADVNTEFITAELTTAAGTWNALAAGDDIGDYKLRTAAATSVPTAEFVYFTNGDVAGNDTAAAATATTYTFAVELSGNYVTRIYSANLWAVDADNWVDADDLEELEDDKLLGESFTLTNKDVRDDESYDILGVASVDDIKKGNVVAVYSDTVGTPEIVRIEVGTKTVSGTVSRVNSALNTVTVAGTAYKISALPGQNIGGVVAGDKGTFYLDYEGKLYHFEVEDTNHLYGVVLDQDPGTQGVNGNSPKIKIFTEEGKTVTYTCVESLVNLGSPNTWKTAPVVGDLVDFTLNSDGLIRTCAVPAMVTVAAAADITKSGTIDGLVIDSETVLFNLVGTDYSVVKRADVLGKSVTTGYEHVTTSGVIDAVILNSVAGSDKVFYAFQNWDYVDTEDFDYEVFFVGSDGKTVSFFTNDNDGATPPLAQDPNGITFNVAAELQTFDVTPAGELVAATLYNSSSPEYLAYTLSGTSTTCKRQGDVYILSDGTTDMTLASDVVVLTKKVADDKWTVKTTTALRGLDTTNTTSVEGFDTSSTADSVIDVVFVVQP